MALAAWRRTRFAWPICPTPRCYFGERPLVGLSDRVLSRGIDARLIDGIGVNGTARLVAGSADHALKFLQTGA